MPINPRSDGSKDLREVQRVADLGSLPDDVGSNASFALSWTGTQLDYVEKTLLGVTWRKTLTWGGGVLLAVSEWVEQP